MNGGDSSKNMNGSLRQNAIFIKKKKKEKRFWVFLKLFFNIELFNFFFKFF